MPVATKSAQLQIRVSAAEKAAIRRAAQRAGLGMSALYLLTHSPAPFRRRNIFVDAGIGSRV